MCDKKPDADELIGQATASRWAVLVFGGLLAPFATAWILAAFLPKGYSGMVAGVPGFIRGWLP